MDAAPEPVARYGEGGRIPFRASLEEPRADFGSGLLLRAPAALVALHDGDVLRIASPVPMVAADLRDWERLGGPAVLAVADDPERSGWRLHYVRKGRARTEPAHRGAAATTDPVATVTRRLWLYTNYDCNLQCDYCCVLSSPTAAPRRLPPERIRALVEEAASLGFECVFFTGGEPLLRDDLPELVAFATDRIPLTLLTNGMLLRGPRWDRLRPLVPRSLTFQVSLDSATPERHDRHRGHGSHRRALEGIRTLLDARAHVRIAATIQEAYLDEIPLLHALADRLGLAAEDRIFRPLALRGAATEGAALRSADLAPDLTCDADGFFWHPLSGDADMRLPVPYDAGVGEALAAVRGELERRQRERGAAVGRFVCG
ncbi:hypothetical protein BH18CHL2_BH18CHL2_03590 [soil metagenome]